MNKKVILITGGAGYIGSHTCVALCEAGYTPLILDNFSNSTPAVLDRLEILMKERPLWIEGDIRDAALLNKIFQDYDCSGVIHFAGLKAVGESMSQPLNYYDVNVGGSIFRICRNGRVSDASSPGHAHFEKTTHFETGITRPADGVRCCGRFGPRCARAAHSTSPTPLVSPRASSFAPR